MRWWKVAVLETRIKGEKHWSSSSRWIISGSATHNSNTVQEESTLGHHLTNTQGTKLTSSLPIRDGKAVSPGADCDTDHQLVMVTWHMRFKSLKRNPPPLHFDLENISTEYTVSVNNKFETLLATQEEKCPEELWTTMKTMILESADKHLIKKKFVKKQPWISDDTLKIANKKREVRSRGINTDEYKELNRQVKRGCRKDKTSSLATSATILKNKQKETTPKDYFKQSRHWKETTIKK